MSIKDIRTYISDQINKLDSDYYEHLDAFSTNNIGEQRSDKAFHVFYGNVSNISVDQATRKDSVNVTLSLFSKTNRDSVEELENILEFSNKASVYISNPRNYSSSPTIKFVKFISMQAEPLPGNDNSPVVKIQFQFTIIQGLGVNLDCDC